MARRSSLVCQYLENISREALEKHQEIIKDFTRGRQGIYALFGKGRLYYVGLAGNLRSRLHQHLRDRHGRSWDRFSVYLTLGDRHLQEMESLILRIVKPSGNKVRAKFSNAANLRNTFKRQISEKQRAELLDLVGISTGQGAVKRRIKRRNGSKEDISKNKRSGILKKYMNKKFMFLKVRYRGKAIAASVLKNGTIRLDGRLYASPSAAAQAVVRHAVNGWRFWLFRSESGAWRPLTEIRGKR